MNTNKIAAHAVAVAKFDDSVDKSAGVFGSDLLLVMIDAGAVETENGNYKFQTLAEYKKARSVWTKNYGQSRGWTPESGKRNPGDNRFSDLGGTNFNPNTADISSEEAEQAANATESNPLDELNAERAELLKAFNKAIRKNENDAAHKITDKLLALELVIAAAKM